MALAASVRSQEEEKAAPPEGTTLPATARILGDISDGTPPPPAEAKPAFVVPANDILSTTTHQQGGRTITIQRIKPIALPPPLDPAPAPAEVALDETARQERVAALRAKHPEWELLILGVTVFRSTDSPPRTLVALQFSSDLSEGSWFPVDVPLIGTGTIMGFGVIGTGAELGGGVPLEVDGSIPDSRYWRVTVNDIDYYRKRLGVHRSGN